MPDPDFDFMERDNSQQLHAAKTKLADVFTKEKQTYTYIYDFGDDWVHKIALEKMSDEAALSLCQLHIFRTLR